MVIPSVVPTMVLVLVLQSTETMTAGKHARFGCVPLVFGGEVRRGGGSSELIGLGRNQRQSA